MVCVVVIMSEISVDSNIKCQMELHGLSQIGSVLSLKQLLSILVAYLMFIWHIYRNLLIYNAIRNHGLRSSNVKVMLFLSVKVYL